MFTIGRQIYRDGTEFWGTAPKHNIYKLKPISYACTAYCDCSIKVN